MISRFTMVYRPHRMVSGAPDTVAGTCAVKARPDYLVSVAAIAPDSGSGVFQIRELGLVPESLHCWVRLPWLEHLSHRFSGCRPAPAHRTVPVYRFALVLGRRSGTVQTPDLGFEIDLGFGLHRHSRRHSVHHSRRHSHLHYRYHSGLDLKSSRCLRPGWIAPVA